MYQVQTLRRTARIPLLKVAKEYEKEEPALAHAHRLATGTRPPLFTHVYDTQRHEIIASYMLGRRCFD